MKYKTLRKNIRQGKIGPVYLFAGPETNIADMLENEIVKKTIPAGMEMLNLNRYDGKDIDFTELLASFETLPVMSQKRVVVVGEKSRIFEQTDEVLLAKLESYLKNPLDSTVLILRAEKPDKRRRLYKWIKEYGEVVDLTKLNYNDLSSWIKSRFEEAGVVVRRDSIDRIIERSHYLENDSMETRTIDRWIEQLIDYIGLDQEISKEVIDEVIPAGIEEDVFKIIDMAVAGKLRGVQRELSNLWEHGESPIRIFALLLYQLRNITKTNILLSRRFTKQRIAGELKLAPFIINKLVPIARKYDDVRLLELMVEAADLDYKMKTGQVDPYFGLEYFILKLNVTRSMN